MANRPLRLSRSRSSEPETVIGGSISEPITPADDFGEVEYSSTDSSDFIAPESAERAPESEPPKRKRGRPAGSATKSKRESASSKETPENIADVLYSIHLGISSITQSELFEIDEAEAAKLGAAIARVNKYYSLRGISPKQMAWVNLISAAGSVYGPRIVAAARMARAKKNKGKVTVMPPPAEPERKKETETIEG